MLLRLAPVALLLAHAGAPARAQVLHPPPAADPRLYAPPSARPEASGFACSAETLVSGVDCIMESDAPAATATAAQAQDNRAVAAALATWACAAVSRPTPEATADPSVQAQCERAFKERALECGAAGARPLLDAQGRFAPEARACYAALGLVLAAARTQAAVTVPCCRCLAAARCLEAARCNGDLLSWPLPARAAACLREACPTACRSFQPDPGPAADGPGPKAGATHQILIHEVP